MNGILVFVGGSDPSGGAGLPADLKTASALGFHGCPVVTALTVQNSSRVLSWSATEPRLFHQQLLAVLDDGPVDAIKSGMLGSVENAGVLAGAIGEMAGRTVYVLDPVLASGSGTSLVEEGMLEMIRSRLLPLCTLCTPNLDEAALITGIGIKGIREMEEAGRSMLEMGAGSVLVKGGHLSGDPVDVLVTREGSVPFSGTRITDENVHGTGCTLASACCAFLAGGFPVVDAVERSRRFVRNSISRRIKRRSGWLPGHFPQVCPAPAGPDGSSFYTPPAFCSMCGEPMNRGAGEHGHLFCSACGHVHYRNPLPAVAVVVEEEGRILLVERAVPPGKGKLCLPGGFMEIGESPLECARRELLEETGLEMGSGELLDLETDTTAYGGILLVVVRAVAVTGKLSAGDDAADVHWKPLQEVPELAFRAHNRIVSMIRGNADAG